MLLGYLNDEPKEMDISGLSEAWIQSREVKEPGGCLDYDPRIYGRREYELSLRI
jgi:hypothetical protein